MIDVLRENCFWSKIYSVTIFVFSMEQRFSVAFDKGMHRCEVKGEFSADVMYHDHREVNN